MKRTALLLCFLMWGTLVYSQITTLTGPAPACPTGSNVCIVNYFTLPPSAFYNEYVIEVKWDFSQGGQIFKTLYSSGFSQIGFPGAANIAAGNLPLGTVNVAVRVKVFVQIFGSFTFKYHYKNININVGLGTPAFLAGPGLICPGSASVFTCTSVPGASSYTWEVPSYWTVNGISGPIVAGQGNTVTISVPACDNVAFHRYYTNGTSGTVKAKAVSSTCGTGSAQSKFVYVDYPVSISESVTPDGILTLATNYSTFDSYWWQIPQGWQLLSARNEYTITFNTNGLAGTPTVEYRTTCGCVYGLAYYYEPYIEPPPPPPPPPCCEYIQVYPNPASNELMIRGGKRKISEVAIDMEGRFNRVAQDGESVRIDVSHLTPGLHILRVKDASGAYHAVRFVKSKE